MKFSTKELQKQIHGQVLTTDEALDYFSTDGSIFKMRPQAIVYPTGTYDVYRTVEYLAGLAQAGERIPVTARGKGTDQAGGAVNDGVMMVFPAHMNRLKKLEKESAIIQPGLLYKDFQNTLKSHGRFLPPYPSSIDFSTLGGAVANNACGEKTIKYGCTRDYVKRLRVVLSNGEVIETRRLTSRELHRKKGLDNFEGEIYRGLDGLLTDYRDLVATHHPQTTKNSSGYDLWDVKGKDGSFDLTPLFVGSQGTLGIVTEIEIKTLPFNPKTTLVAGYFDDIRKAGQAVLRLQKLKPSALEIVDYNLLAFLRENKPETIAGVIPEELPKIVLLIEFDDTSQVRQTLKMHKAQRIVAKLGTGSRAAKNPQEQEALWRIRRSAAAVIWMNRGKKKALPIIEDGVVPVEKLPEFLGGAYKILKKHNLTIAVWGHAGNANLHMQPFMDLSQKKEREKVFKVADDFYKMVIAMGGSTCGEHNDGLMRSPWLKKLYGDEMYELFMRVKHLFDPHDIMNPGKKTDLPIEHIKKLVNEERHEYGMAHLYDHMPHN
jgi:FAD/FMN-containing dehydrogenase